MTAAHDICIAKFLGPRAIEMGCKCHCPACNPNPQPPPAPKAVRCGKDAAAGERDETDA